jgi:hypothetical protein
VIPRECVVIMTRADCFAEQKVLMRLHQSRNISPKTGTARRSVAFLVSSRWAAKTTKVAEFNFLFARTRCFLSSKTVRSDEKYLFLALYLLHLIQAADRSSDSKIYSCTQMPIKNLHSLEIVCISKTSNDLLTTFRRLRIWWLLASLPRG